MVKCVLDQNFPAQTGAVGWPSGVEVLRLPAVAPDLVRDVEDWEILLELAHRGFEVFITNDGRMLDSAREMVALSLTPLRLIVTVGAGNNALKANGLLQVHLMDLLHDTAQKTQIHTLRPGGRGSTTAGRQLNLIARHQNVAPEDLHLRELRAIGQHVRQARAHLLPLIPSSQQQQ